MSKYEFSGSDAQSLHLAQGQAQMISGIHKGEVEVKENELRLDQVWIGSSRMLYEAYNGAKFEGSDEEAAQYGLDQMSNQYAAFFNADTKWAEHDSKGLVEVMNSFEGWSPEQQLAFGYMYETYEAKDMSVAGFGRGLRALVQDVTNLATVGGPLALAARWGGREAAKTGFRIYLRHWMRKNLLAKGVTIGAADGAIIMGADDAMRQNLEQSIAGTRPEWFPGDDPQRFDVVRNLQMAATGALFGAGLATLIGSAGLVRGVKQQLDMVGRKPFDLSETGGLDFERLTMTNALLDDYPQAAPLIQFMSTRELEVLNRANMSGRYKLVNDLVEKYEQMDLPAEMATIATAGQAKRGWYKESGALLSEVFGDDFPRFAALLAATSPQLGVKGNLINALNIWKNWDAAGRPTDPAIIKQIMGDSVQGDKGVESLLPAWFDNSVTALTEPEANILLSGAKVDSFMRNIMGDTDSVTLDTWMANYFGTDQSKFYTKAQPGWEGDPGFTPEYQAVSVITRKAAAILSERTEQTWTPAEIQETVWSFVKPLIEMRRGGDTRSIDEIIKSGDITDQVVRGVDDFATLLGSEDVGGILKGTDYDRNLTRALARRPGESGVNESATSQGFTGRTVEELGHLDQAGLRLERAHQKRSAPRVIANIRKSLDRTIAARVDAAEYGSTVAGRARHSKGHTDTFAAGSRTYRSNNLGSVPYRIHTLASRHAAKLNDIEHSTPPLVELKFQHQDADGFVAGGKVFYDAIKAARDSGDYGAAVYLYDAPGMLEGEIYGLEMRLFLTKDSKAGFALKGDDIVSVFNHADSKYQSITSEMLLLAVQEGGRRLDAFDTVLPGIYTKSGFRVVARVKWNDEFAPPDWDKATFAKWNKGEPDTVYMVYDPDYVATKPYNKNQGVEVKTGEEAVAMVNAELKLLGQK